MHWAKKYLKSAQVYGRKITHATKVYGRKFAHHADQVGDHLIAHGGVYSRSIGNEIKGYANQARNIAAAADHLDNNKPAQAIATLGFN